jgi:hypothetical protein
MDNTVNSHIEEIITSKIHKIPNSKLIQYTDTYVWLEKPGESFIEGFRNNYPAEFNEEVNCIFDEIHPY